MTNICSNELRPYLSINYMFITIIFLVLCAKKKVNCLLFFFLRVSGFTPGLSVSRSALNSSMVLKIFVL